MKKVILFTMLILSIGITVKSQNVGVNTINPQALFHLDGASSVATTNPQNGAVSAQQLSDDVVISNLGNVSLGAGLNPTQKLDVVTPAANQGLRIVDGTQGVMRVLVSDDSGVGMWSQAAGLWTAALLRCPTLDSGGAIGDMQCLNFGDQVITSTTDGAVNRVNGTITIPYNGLYRIFMSSWYSNTHFNGVYIAGLELRVNNVAVWTPSSMGSGPTYGCRPSFMQMMELRAGDILSFFVIRRGNNYAYVSAGADVSVELIQVN